MILLIKSLIPLFVMIRFECKLILKIKLSFFWVDFLFLTLLSEVSGLSMGLTLFYFVI